MPGGLQLDAKAWTPEEDHIILDMHASDGPKWSTIVQALPGRTISSVRNRWQRLEKGRKLREAGLESRNRCHACGKAKRGHICYAKARGGPQVIINNPLALPDASQPPALNAPTYHGPTRHSRRHAARARQPDYLATLTALDFLPALGGAEPHIDEASSVSESPSPMTVAAEPPTLTVDLSLLPTTVNKRVSFSVPAEEAVAPSALVPALERSNTSFFNALADSAVFTPSSKALFESWAGCTELSSESAEPFAVPPALLKENSSSQLTTPSLFKDLSFSQLAPPLPTLQRSFDSFNYSMWQSAPSPAMVRTTA